MHLQKAEMALTISLLILSSSLFGQSEPSAFWSLKIHRNHILNSENPFFNGRNSNLRDVTKFHGFQGEMGWQTRRLNAVNQKLKYPAFGLGVSSFHFSETNELGSPFTLYSFINAPFIRGSRFSLKYLLRLGLSLNWKPEHPILNPYNTVIGSHNNLFIGSGLSFEYSLLSHLVLSSELSYSHLSNSHRSTPNIGLNFIKATFGVIYHIDNYEGSFKKLDFPIEDYTDRNEFYFAFGFGSREYTFSHYELDRKAPYVSKKYRIYNLSMGIQRQIGYLLKLGGGLDIANNGLINARVVQEPDGSWIKVKTPAKEKLQVGIFGSLEWVIHDLSIIVQSGYKVIDQEYIRKQTRFYQHLGIKYHVDNLILGMGVRSVKFSESEYLEVNVGYRLVWF